MGKNKKVFIILTHYYSPGEEEGKHNLTEKCEFVDDIKSRHHTGASVILDFMNKKVIKQRQTDYSYYHYLEYVSEKYPKQMEELTREYKHGKKNTFRC